MSNNLLHLKSAILPLSHAQDWDEARLEWELTGIEYADGCPQTCPCTHYPIFELCTISNKLTRKNIVVGNVCVQRFLNIESADIFRSLSDIADDPDGASPSLRIIEFLVCKGIVNNWEHDFLIHNRGRQRFSEKQMMKRAEINKKILRYVYRVPPTTDGHPG